MELVDKFSNNGRRPTDTSTIYYGINISKLLKTKQSIYTFNWRNNQIQLDVSREQQKKWCELLKHYYYSDLNDTIAAFTDDCKNSVSERNVESHNTTLQLTYNELTNAVNQAISANKKTGALILVNIMKDTNVA